MISNWLPTHRLKLGMYVSDLDRPWTDTPFLFQGFQITSDSELESLRELCQRVAVEDADGSLSRSEAEPEEPKVPGDAKRLQQLQALRQHQVSHAAPPQRYQDTVTMAEELERARKIRENSLANIKELFDRVARGEAADTRGALQGAEDIVQSVLRNPDALTWLTCLKRRDDYTAQHSFNVCVQAVTFGRHLGLEPESMTRLGIGALLHDVGKLRVPLEVLNKPGKLTLREFDLMKAHPDHGRRLLARSGELPEAALDVAFSHHERLDGRGYPRGLKAAELSPYSRMVAVVDVYDALTSDRCYHDGIATDVALARLYDWSEKELDSKLVERFIESMGVFPVGSLVLLSDDSVAVVDSLNRNYPAHPVVRLLLHTDGSTLLQSRLENLANHRQDPQGLRILRTLPPGSQGLHPAELIRRA